MQRIFVQFKGALFELVKQLVFSIDVALEQRLRELVLVGEMIEEPALGNADIGYDLFDRAAANPFSITLLLATSSISSRFPLRCMLMGSGSDIA